MTDRTSLRERIDTLPDNHLAAVERFIDYLKKQPLRDDHLVAVEQFIDYLQEQSLKPLIAMLAQKWPNYETDYYQWTQDQAAILRAEKFQWLATLGMDLDNLAEEIESLGRSDRDAIESQLVRLLLHLLKLIYDPATRPRRGWRVTVADAREQVARKATGGLQHHPAAYLPVAYRYARRKAALATERPLTAFPEACPWPIEQVLDEEFFPETSPC